VQQLQALYDQYLHSVYGYVSSRVGHREEAEDLTSLIFLKAIERLDPDYTPNTIRYWLFQITRTVLADYYRARSRTTFCSLEALLEVGWQGPLEGPTVAMVQRRARNRIHRLFQALPEQYRAVLFYRFLLDLSVRETAQQMGISEANVKVLQFRALKRAAKLEEGMVSEQADEAGLEGEIRWL
jgi:RNA polymerase sigma-70 factor, ECF subfamily